MIEAALYTISIVSLFRILYYAIGEPSHSQNPQAILSCYTDWLAKKTLSNYGLDYYQPNIGKAIEEAESANDCWGLNLNKAMPLFKWQFVLGICPVCTFFHISFLFIFLPLLLTGTPLLTAFFFYTTSNILNKIFIKWI